MTEATLHPDVIAMARDGEPDRYLAATLSPAPQRAALIAVAAYAADLRRIPSVVKEPMMGEVRLQWWRDVITAFDRGETTGHPIADALAAAVRAHRLPALSLIAMTEARAFDLYEDPMPDAAAFAGYLAKTEAIPFALAETILTGRDTPATCDLAARSYGMARLLADLPSFLARGRVPLPLSLLDVHGLTGEALIAGQGGVELRALVQQACREIGVAVAALQKMPRAGRLAFLPVAVVPALVKALVLPGRDPLRAPAEISPLTRVVRLARARWLHV
jgi:15-cis-phytoene synthase